MLSQHTPPAPGFNDTYSYRLDRFYKIWFSNNKDVFLDMENQLRFIRLRIRNTQAQLAFVFSSQCLTQTAHNQLTKFCAHYNIIPINFAGELCSLKLDAFDQRMYDIAKLELQKFIAGEDGSLASASDCVRLIKPLIVKYGIYSDFDVEHTLAKLNSSFITTRAPVLLHSLLVMQQNFVIVSPNSDFLAFSCDQQSIDNLSLTMKLREIDIPLSAQALQAIRNIQLAIIRNYTDKFTANTLVSNKELLQHFPQQYFTFFRENKNPTIFTFRNYVADAEIPKPQKNILYKLSVIGMSGPDLYPKMYAQLIPKSCKSLPFLIPKKDKKWLNYLATFNKSSVLYYDALADQINLKNNISSAINSPAPQPPGSLADHSWTPEGMTAKMEREKTIQKAALIITKFFKSLNPHQVLKNHCAKHIKNKIYLIELEKRQYNLVLRKASADLNYPLLHILLRFSARLNIAINAPSSNGNTALDWAKQAESATKFKVIELLINHGAKTNREAGLYSTPKVPTSIKMS